MHNESQAEREPESVPSSKLSRIKDAAIVTAWIAIPVVTTVGLSYLSYKMTKMNFDAAKLNLENAKLNQQS